MRHWSLVALAGATWAVAACHDTLPAPTGPDVSLVRHFDSLSAEAHAASQLNRVAALDLALRAMADGAIPSGLAIKTGSSAGDVGAYNTVTWSSATLATGLVNDTVTDSLMVLVGWRNDADTMIVIRSGDTRLAPQVRAELSTLGLTSHIVTSDTTDTLTSAALVTGNSVAVADSGSVQGVFGIFGASCQFVAVTSVANDNDGTQCNRELLLWDFALRFSPSVRWVLQGSGGAYSQGVVVVH